MIVHPDDSGLKIEVRIVRTIPLKLLNLLLCGNSILLRFNLCVFNAIMSIANGESASQALCPNTPRSHRKDTHMDLANSSDKSEALVGK